MLCNSLHAITQSPGSDFSLHADILNPPLGSYSIGKCIQAAPFLEEVAQQQQDTNKRDLSAEQFSIRKEEEKKALGAEIITIDTDYASKVGASPRGYKPKVATW